MSEYQGIIYRIVSKIPRGKVLTYQKIAQLAGMKSPRSVGNILHKNKNPEKVPCHRVVRSDGTLAYGYAFGGIKRQEEKLREEGVEIINAKANLDKYLWHPQKTKKHLGGGFSLTPRDKKQRNLLFSFFYHYFFYYPFLSFKKIFEYIFFHDKSHEFFLVVNNR